MNSTTDGPAAGLVGVVTVNYHSEAVLPGLLESVHSQQGVLVSGVVADNAGSAAARQLAFSAGFAYIALDNPGYGGAINAAIAALPTSVEWVLVSNPDVVLGEGAIAELVAHGRSAADIGAVGPRVLDDNGNVYPSARAIPSLRTGIGHALLGAWWPRNPWTTRYLRSADLSAPQPRDTGWLSGSCLLVRRAAFDAVGGFDERYFMYFEDVDLGFRLGRAGWRNVYDPAAEVRHIGGTSTAAASARMVEEHHRSAALFLARKYPGRLLAPMRAVIEVGLRARSMITLRRAR